MLYGASLKEGIGYFCLSDSRGRRRHSDQKVLRARWWVGGGKSSHFPLSEFETPPLTPHLRFLIPPAGPSDFITVAEFLMTGGGEESVYMMRLTQMGL